MRVYLIISLIAIYIAGSESLATVNQESVTDEVVDFTSVSRREIISSSFNCIDSDVDENKTKFSLERFDNPNPSLCESHESSFVESTIYKWFIGDKSTRKYVEETWINEDDILLILSKTDDLIMLEYYYYVYKNNSKIQKVVSDRIQIICDKHTEELQNTFYTYKYLNLKKISKTFEKKIHEADKLFIDGLYLHKVTLSTPEIIELNKLEDDKISESIQNYIYTLLSKYNESVLSKNTDWIYDLYKMSQVIPFLKSNIMYNNDLNELAQLMIKNLISLLSDESIKITKTTYNNLLSFNDDELTNVINKKKINTT